MEDFLILLFQFLIEVVLQSLLELPFDMFVDSRDPWYGRVSKRSGWIISSLIAGGVLGGVSLLIRPNTFLKSSATRILYLILAPPLSAAGSFMLARWVSGRKRGEKKARMHAVCAFCFALAMTVVRFAFADR